jgi:hypothetical protein
MSCVVIKYMIELGCRVPVAHNSYLITTVFISLAHLTSNTARQMSTTTIQRHEVYYLDSLIFLASSFKLVIQ